MNYFTTLFSPETYQAFSHSDRTISGFRMHQKGMAGRVKPGDILVCYLTRVSRWVGCLQVVAGPFIDNQPLFVPESDPFVVRLRVKTLVWLEIDMALPIHDESIWRRLSFTSNREIGSTAWTSQVRASLLHIDSSDGEFLVERLKAQAAGPKPYPLDEQDRKQLKTYTVNLADKVVTVSVPDDASPTELAAPAAIEAQTRESIRIQALIARIGSAMGYAIWIPRADRGAVSKEWQDEHRSLLQKLPLNYDHTTLDTIERIDVLWLRRHSIVRAFEVEHTTSIHSGILRMADLLSLQPNMGINLHIAAPTERREKVFQEIRRPVFTYLEKGPLKKFCTYLSYECLRDLSTQKHLAHLSDMVLDEYAEEAE